MYLGHASKIPLHTSKVKLTRLTCPSSFLCVAQKKRRRKLLIGRREHHMDSERAAVVTTIGKFKVLCMGINYTILLQQCCNHYFCILLSKKNFNSWTTQKWQEFTTPLRSPYFFGSSPSRCFSHGNLAPFPIGLGCA